MTPWDVFAEFAAAEEERLESLASGDATRMRAALDRHRDARERVGMLGQMLVILALEYGGEHLGRTISIRFGELARSAWDRAVRANDRAVWVSAKTDALEQRVRELERLVMTLADKLATVAEHLGRLSERRELRHARAV